MPSVSKSPSPKMPRWAAIMRLPKPTTVVRPLTKTAKNVLRGRGASLGRAERDGKHGQRRAGRCDLAERQQGPEPEVATVGGDHEASETDRGREAVDEDREERAPRQSRPAALPRLVVTEH